MEYHEYNTLKFRQMVIKYHSANPASRLSSIKRTYIIYQNNHYLIFGPSVNPLPISTQTNRSMTTDVHVLHSVTTAHRFHSQ